MCCVSVASPCRFIDVCDCEAPEKCGRLGFERLRRAKKNDRKTLSSRLREVTVIYLRSSRYEQGHRFAVAASLRNVDSLG